MEHDLIQHVRNFSRVWPRAPRPVQKLLDLAMMAVQLIQIPQAPLPQTLQSPVDLHDRCMGMADRQPDEDLAERLREAAWVFLELGRQRQEKHASAISVVGTHPNYACNLEQEGKPFSFTVRHGTEEAMWSYATRIKLAITLATQRLFFVGELRVGIELNQVATLHVFVNKACFGVTTEVTYLPRLITAGYIEQQRNTAHIRRGFWSLAKARFSRIFVKPDDEVDLARVAALRHVSDSIEGLGQPPSTADNLRKRTAG